MAQRTIDHFYPTYAEAVQVVADLTSSGVSPANVSLIESETDARLPRDLASDNAQNPVASGTTLGAAIGGGIGALNGIGAVSIPYGDTLAATGWILPCIVFAIAGGLVGALVGTVVRLGLGNRAGHVIATRLQRGQQLVMVRADEDEVALVQSIMARSHTIPTAALATSEPLYDLAVPTAARTVDDEVDPPRQPARRPQFR